MWDLCLYGKGGIKSKGSMPGGCSYQHFPKQPSTFHIDRAALPRSPASAVLFHAPFPLLWFWRWIHSRWRKNFSHVQDVRTPACTAASAPVPSASLQWAAGTQTGHVAPVPAQPAPGSSRLCAAPPCSDTSAPGAQLRPDSPTTQTLALLWKHRPLKLLQS